MAKKQSNIATQEHVENTFICESCDKSAVFTSKEREKKKKTDPDLFMQGFDYYIPCHFCTNGRMVSQLDLVFHQMATDIFGD